MFVSLNWARLGYGCFKMAAVTMFCKCSDAHCHVKFSVLFRYCLKACILVSAAAMTQFPQRGKEISPYLIT